MFKTIFIALFDHKNINNIKPINLFLNNNISHIKQKKYNSGTNLGRILFDKKVLKTKKDNASKYSENNVKLPFIDSKNNGNLKRNKRLLNIIN